MRISDWSSDVCSSDLGHAIGGLTINRPSADYVGLFGFQGGGTISRTGVIGVSVIGDQDVGGLVGHQVGGSIGQSYATGSVTGDHYVGGLVGAQYDGSVSQSYATGSVTGSVTGNITSVGGLVGLQDGGSSVSQS